MYIITYRQEDQVVLPEFRRNFRDPRFSSEKLQDFEELCGRPGLDQAATIMATAVGYYYIYDLGIKSLAVCQAGHAQETQEHAQETQKHA